MNKPTGQTAYIKSGKWDEQTIEQVYQGQLDELGDILDRIQLLGYSALFQTNPILKVVQRLLEQLEKELLFQWQVKQTEGLERLFERQKKWLNHELRSPEGLFDTWNCYCRLIWDRLESPTMLLDSHPWRSALLEILTDRQAFHGFPGLFHSNRQEAMLGDICELFEVLHGICPHHQIISFLNLIEIGTGKRPEICNPGEADLVPNPELFPSPIATLVSAVSSKEGWKTMPALLQQFWDRNSGGILSLFSILTLTGERASNTTLKGVQSTRIKADDLVGVDENRQQLMENIKCLLAGGQSQHTLLCGDAGTGKTSLVLTLADQFAADGLRLIHIPRRERHTIATLPDLLRGMRERFILFFDDATSNEESTGDSLKKIIGDIPQISTPNFFVIAATDQPLQQAAEFHLPLDHFGLRLFFEPLSPNQLEEILIIQAKRSGLSYEEKDLSDAFKQFTKQNRQHKPTGRSVQQFMQTWLQQST